MVFVDMLDRARMRDAAIERLQLEPQRLAVEVHGEVSEVRVEPVFESPILLFQLGDSALGLVAEFFLVDSDRLLPRRHLFPLGTELALANFNLPRERAADQVWTFLRFLRDRKTRRKSPRRELIVRSFVERQRRFAMHRGERFALFEQTRESVVRIRYPPGTHIVSLRIHAENRAVYRRSEKIAIVRHPRRVAIQRGKIARRIVVEGRRRIAEVRIVRHHRADRDEKLPRIGHRSRARRILLSRCQKLTAGFSQRTVTLTSCVAHRQTDGPKPIS